MSEKDNKTIIFIETKKRVDEITFKMKRDGWPAECIHGDKTQEEREKVLNIFRSGRKPILVATDVAARGLDVEDVKFVINFDYPTNSEDYVHRIGRTGRSNNTGTAYTFFTSANASKAKDLLAVLKEANQVINPKLEEIAEKAGDNMPKGRGRGKRGFRRQGRQQSQSPPPRDRSRSPSPGRRSRSPVRKSRSPPRKSRRSRSPKRRRSPSVSKSTSRSYSRSSSSRSISISPPPRKRRRTSSSSRSRSA